MRNRFKGLDLIDRVPDELWTEVHDIIQETGIKTIPMEKKCKKIVMCAQMCALQMLLYAVLKRNAKKQNGFLRRPYKEL